MENNNEFDQQINLEEPKKKNNISSIIFSLIFIILLAIIGFLTYTRVIEYQNKLHNRNNATQETEKQKIEEENKTTSEIKEIILSKTNSLFNISKDKTSDSIYDVGYKKEIFEKLTIDNDNKLRIALTLSKKNNLYSAKKDVSRPEVIAFIDDYIKHYTIEQYFSGDYSYEYSQLDADDVQRKYKELFNETLEHKDVKDFCPFIYYYDSKSNQYYANKECGGTGYNEILYYFDEVTSTENETYAYIYIGYKDNNEYNSSDIKIYSDIDKKNVIETLATDSNKNYTITNTNKENFTKYKITYKKDSSNNYYYSKIEKIEK